MAEDPGDEGRRRGSDGDASAALRRFFEAPGGQPPPGRGGRAGGARGDQPTQPVASTRDRLVHDALMAGLDSHAGRPANGRRREELVETEPVAVAAPGGGGTAVAGEEPTSPDTLAERRQADEVTRQARTALRDGEDHRGDDLTEEELAFAGLGRRRGSFNPLGAVLKALTNGLVEAGEMTWLTGSVLRSAITRPKGYWGETKEQIYSALKLCWVPMIISVTAFGIGAPGLQGGNVFTIFGVPEREGSFIVATGIREFAPWIDAMIVAGVVGTAITADIGARRIREEIDAMEVLGVDPIRELVLPRILSTAIITGLFDIVALLVGIVGGYIAAVLLLGASTAGYTGQFLSQANVPDLVGSFAKTFLFGGVVGVVCCYKGMRASGGPAGVGKAVNQAVVISFALIWTINYVFTNTLLGFAPSTQVFH